MRHTQVVAAVGVFALHIAASASPADEHAVHPDIVAGFAPHRQRCPGGNIDWTGGFIIADGRGIAESMDRQGQLLARRAAEVVAARNALAIAAGINVDAEGCAGDVRNGRVMLEGVIKGHEVVGVKWHFDRKPPEVRVQLRVPVWGVKSVSNVCCDVHRRRIARSGIRRLPLVVDRGDVSDSVLVIDARGTGLEPSLFPVVVTEEEELLHDVGRLSPETARRRPPARFVETDLTFDRLRAGVDDGRRRPDRKHRSRARLASYADPQLPAPPEAQPAATQPSSQPAEHSRRRARRRVVIKAAAASGDRKARIVVTAEDAEKLRRSVEGASLLREGQVVIVVDSAAAGTQGRRDPWTGETPVLAHAPSP